MKVLKGTEHDIGNLIVRRFLPGVPKMVGPFIFFDHFGPATFEAGQGIDVRPHPHCHLATITYLLEGGLQHQDSLGNNMLVEPGAINLMVAGKGIVHSERTPAAAREQGSCLAGIQCWIALPEDAEDVPPSFTHYAKEDMPVIEKDGLNIHLLIGSLLGQSSPVKTDGNVLYADVVMPSGKALSLPAPAAECAIYIIEGTVEMNGAEHSQHLLIVMPDKVDINLIAKADCRFMILGGEPVGNRFIEWNFVGSTKEKIQEAKAAWASGPSKDGGRFPVIPSDKEEYIPLPPQKHCGEDSGVM